MSIMLTICHPRKSPRPNVAVNRAGDEGKAADCCRSMLACAMDAIRLLGLISFLRDG